MKKIYIILGLFCCFAYLYGKKTKNIQPAAFALSSPAFSSFEMMPQKYTCDGINISPELRWVHAPTDTKSFALIMDDPDSQEKNWTHWLIFNIPPQTNRLPEGIESHDFISAANDFYYMKNSIWHYCGPCPPDGTHHYHFTLYALDTILNLNQDTNAEELKSAMQGHILAEAKLVGLYQRKK